MPEVSESSGPSPFQPNPPKDTGLLRIQKSDNPGIVQGSSAPIPPMAQLSFSEPDAVSPLDRLFEQHVHLMRQRGLALLSDASIDPSIIQDFISKNFDHLIEGLVSLCIDEVGPSPTEFCILGLGSLSREEASPYSDLDFAIAFKEDSSSNRAYFLTLCSKMNDQLMKLNEHRKPNRGIAFCEGGLNPPYRTGKSNISFGSASLIDTPSNLAKWSGVESLDFDRRQNSASQGVVKKALQQVHMMCGDKKLFDELQSSRHHILDTKLPSSKLVRQETALSLLRSATPISKSTASSLDLKNSLARPLQEIVGGLSLFFGIDEPNIVKACDHLVKAGHLHPDSGKQMKEYYNLAYTLRARAQIDAKKEVDNIKLDGSDSFVSPEILQKLESFQPLLLLLRQKQAQFCENGGVPNPFA
jgi:signal-transduction protein with cAMP-binding, CBS, and nucleotidyltransferase domain